MLAGGAVAAALAEVGVAEVLAALRLREPGDDVNQPGCNPDDGMSFKIV